jgi:hypothetical protein
MLIIKVMIVDTLVLTFLGSWADAVHPPTQLYEEYNLRPQNVNLWALGLN